MSKKSVLVSSAILLALFSSGSYAAQKTLAVTVNANVPTNNNWAVGLDANTLSLDYDKVTKIFTPKNIGVDFSAVTNTTGRTGVRLDVTNIELTHKTIPANKFNLDELYFVDTSSLPNTRTKLPADIISGSAVSTTANRYKIEFGTSAFSADPFEGAYEGTVSLTFSEKF
ncbi:exported hypothetical protein [Vibrio crassostreae]|nr:exported hypothetical protein [Vibrio crassostreae]